ncbi:MAG: phosphate ABC transporter permease PstA [Actinobacteria bacterium]|nr:phosphate ABC transporter permease PstA [Actinomycetota bacterium]
MSDSRRRLRRPSHRPSDRVSRTAAAAGAAVGGSLAVPVDADHLPRATRRDVVRERYFKFSLIACVAVSLIVLAILLIDIVRQGAGALSMDFLNNFPSAFPERAGVQSAVMGTLWLMAICAFFVVPTGVAAAIYLEEYADRKRWFNRAIEVNVQNLAAVPSIVYGILGLAFLVRGPFGFGRSVLAGGLTLGLLVLPVVVIASREALRAVPSSIREGAMALGATKWQAIWHQVLPSAIPGISTGAILALSRAIGETAPLIMVGAATYVAFNPDGLNSAFTALPLQIYSWLSSPQEEFKLLAAGAIIVLMAMLLAINSIAIVIRNRYERKW